METTDQCVGRILAGIAQLGPVSTDQLAAVLLGCHPLPTITRDLRWLVEAGHLEKTSTTGFGRHPTRPAGCFALTEKGRELLRDLRGKMDLAIPSVRVKAIGKTVVVSFEVQDEEQARRMAGMGVNKTWVLGRMAP